MILTPRLLPVLLLCAACGAPSDRYPVAAPEVTERIAISFRSVEVREVSLPTYAASDEIAQQTASGVVKNDASALWADAPQRAVALELTRNLVKLTGAKVASDPWPFESYADARLEVRFESLIAEADGVLRSSGQYFVASETGRERAKLFELSVPYALDGGPAAIAQARGQIILDLSRLIAREGLR